MSKIILDPEVKDSLEYHLMDDGMEYTLIHYSNWKEIKDPEFHRLRKIYGDAHRAIENYMNETFDLDLDQ